MRRSLCLAAAILLSGLAGCASKPSAAEPNLEVTPVRVAPPEAALAPGDCKEAVRRAVANPEIDVEKVATPVAMNPVAIDSKKMPRGVADKNGFFDIKFQVLVDTLGKADMKTFTVVNTTHPWLATSVKAAVGKWKFAPAELAGCKVPRLYTLGISPKGKSPAVAPAAKAPATKTTAKKPPR